MSPDPPPCGPAEHGSGDGPELCVLVLEDDPVLLRAFVGRLRRDGHRVDGATTLAEARAALAGRAYDCLVLDRLVPDGDGLDLAADLRHCPSRPPVLVLSSLGEVDKRIEGLRAGADDYVAKPVRLVELATRVRRLGASGPTAACAVVRLGTVVIDRELDRVTADGEELHLTPHQDAVLDYLVAHRHRMVATEELLEHCWDGDRPMFANPLHSQVTRLRRILRGRLRIESVRGAGYLLEVVEPRAGSGEARGFRSRLDGRAARARARA